MLDTILDYIGNISIFVGIILLTLSVGFLVNRFFRRMISRSTDIMQNDPTNYLFIRHAIMAMIYITGFSIAIYSIPSLRTLANSLLAGAGILAVAIGFASQHALGNVISGMFIVIFKPFRINDRLRVREMNGIVEDITLRHTVIRDFENKRIIIPNSLISEDVIVNSDFGEDRICRWIDVGISYDSDLLLAKKILAEEVAKHPNCVDTRTAADIENGVPRVTVRVVLLGESSVNLRAWAWAENSPLAFEMFCDLNERIKLRFDKEGIEIPFPHRTLVYKSNGNGPT